jgi:hypothetical protein
MYHPVNPSFGLQPVFFVWRKTKLMFKTTQRVLKLA